MKKGLEILAQGNIIQWPDQLMSAILADSRSTTCSPSSSPIPSITAEDAQKRFVEIIGRTPTDPAASSSAPPCWEKSGAELSPASANSDHPS
jgi:hypothetical protein